jgi:hypothetical protein
MNREAPILAFVTAIALWTAFTLFILALWSTP